MSTRPSCNGLPPPELPGDPLVRRLDLDRAKWSRAIRGAIPYPTHLAVAHTVAGYANKDGSNAHPGVTRLAVDLCSADKTVKRSLVWLAEHGFITRTSRGARKNGMADTYQLTIPAPLAKTLDMWDRGRCGELWMERPAEFDRSRYAYHSTKNVGDRDVPYNSFLGDIGEFLGDISGVLGDTSVPPPGPKSPGPRGHHSETLSRRHAPRDAVEAEDQDQDQTKALKRAYESEDVEAASSIIGWLVGGYQPDESTMAESMLNDGQHPVAVLNTIRSRRNGCWE